MIEAALPTLSLRRVWVASLIGIDPYPSVTIKAVFNFSVPVIATPKLYPKIAFKLASELDHYNKERQFLEKDLLKKILSEAVKISLVVLIHRAFIIR